MTVSGNRDGKTLGGFRILGEIRGGKGSQGSVFRAVCEKPVLPGVAVGEVVALKTMVARDDSPNAFERLTRRTNALMRLDSPNIVRYKGCFVESGPFNSLNVVVMELLEGETLKERLAVNPGGLDADEAVHIIDLALAGLEASAAAGIVHRDVKPGNIFLCRDGGVKLIDFEIARESTGSVSTASGRFAGTFDYMAPEFSDSSFRGNERSDIFSMGVVFHEALTGDTPYARAKGKGEQADFAFLSRWSQRKEGLCAIRVRSSIKRLLSHADEVILKAVDEEPENRYATVSEFRGALKAIRFRELRSELHSYRLLRIVGKGGFGEVFKARIRGSRDYVAVKHLLKPEYGDRFRREARVMKQLKDPAFVRLVDYFELQRPGGVEAFLVMAFLPGMPGSSLRDAVKRAHGSPMPLRAVLKAFSLYAHALGVMHRQGIYHRDIKPSNLYYPEGEPERAAIMDLGIARDVNGTATTGQVPGTLDYMPPEIVVSGSRGDAGMDIYALGLCLFEAVSGKTAYPRLPLSPTESLKAFVMRARSQIPPNFSGHVMDANPALKALLEEMTAIDPAQRMQDAGVLKFRIDALLEGLPVTGHYDIPEPSQPTRPIPPPPVDDAPTGDTTVETGGNEPQSPSSWKSESPTPRQPSRPAPRPAPPMPAPRPAPQRQAQPRPKPRPAPPPPRPTPAPRPYVPPRPSKPPREIGPIVVKVLSVIVALGAIALGVHIAWKPVANKIKEFSRASEMKRMAELEGIRMKEENERIEKARSEAIGEADDIVKSFDGRVLTAQAAENRALEWQLKWRDNRDVAEIFAAQVKRFDSAKAERVKRDNKEKAEREEAERLRIEDQRAAEARIEAATLEADFLDVRKDTKACNDKEAAWRKKWQNNIRAGLFSELSKMISDAKVKRRDNFLEIDRLRRARDTSSAQAAEIVKKYADEANLPAAVNVDYANWQTTWSDYRNKDFYIESVAAIESAKHDRELLVSSREVAEECDRWLANIETVNSENVKNWRTNINWAESTLKERLKDGKISAKAATEVQKRIDSRKKWAVGVIDNKTYKTVSFCGNEIGPVSSKTIIFKSGVPQGIAITCEGCEPKRVREDAFDGETVTVLRMDARRGGAKARIPNFDKSLVCLIDGVESRPGVVELRAGSHHVVYRRNEETYPGIKDYKDQDFPFYASNKMTVEVPAPMAANWLHSPEFEAAKKDAALVARGNAIVADFEANLVPEPAESRRQRLEKAYSILTDWKTASALAVLGEGVERGLREKYEVERQRIRGYVKNNTGLEMDVTTDTKPVHVPPGGRVLVTFEKEWKADAHVIAPGYEFVFLPRMAEDFDGSEMVVDGTKLTPVPVRVSVPPVEDGVVCQLGKVKIEGSAQIRPGEYECVYTRPDCVRQVFKRVVVPVGEDTVLPAPGPWKPSDALDAFTRAMGRFADGAVGEAKALASKVGTMEDPARRQELEDLKRAIELREKLAR